MKSGLLSCALAALFAASHATAQSTFGTILGAVKDPAGRVMVGVRVKVTNEGIGISKETLTDTNGNCEVTHLNPGPYTIAAEYAGFQRYLHQQVNLETSQLLRLDIQMTVGRVAETVTVLAQAPVVESETG